MDNNSSLFVLNLTFENGEQDSGSITIESESTIDALRNQISEMFKFDVLSISKEPEELIHGTVIESGVVNNDKINVRFREIFVYHILEKGDRITILFSSREQVRDLKKRIAEIIKYNAEDLVLFHNFDILEEEKYVKEYNINDSTVTYEFIRSVGDVTMGEQISEGLFSTVYNAKVIETDELITIKKYNVEQQSFKSMIRELVSFDKLEEHSRIVQLKAFYRDETSFYIGMEHMAGGSIHAYVKRNWPIEENLIAEWSKQILDGLAYLHKNRIIHCDLKTSNILLDKDNNIKISGFSLSKYLNGANSSALSEGFIQSKPGTCNFMAPEVLIEQKISSKADIWSFGAVLVELVTGKVPFHGMESINVILEISNFGRIRYEPPSGMSNQLQDFIGKCLITDRKLRWKIPMLLEHDFLMY